MKRLIAIDPGTEQSAMLVWNGLKVEPHTAMIVSNAAIRSMMEIMPPMPLYVEMVACYGMPVGREVFETCLFIGQLKEIWQQKNLPFTLVYRRDVKTHICGSMKAKDANIRQALIDRLGVVGTKKHPGPLYGVSSHLWAALGVAVYAHDTMKSPGAQIEIREGE